MTVPPTTPHPSPPLGRQGVLELAIVATTAITAVMTTGSTFGAAALVASLAAFRWGRLTLSPALGGSKSP